MQSYPGTAKWEQDERWRNARCVKRDKRIVVAKDDDFVSSFLIAGRPQKLLLISTGNIGNDELEAILRAHINDVAEAFEAASFVELSREFLTVHE